MRRGGCPLEVANGLQHLQVTRRIDLDIGDRVRNRQGDRDLSRHVKEGL